MKVYRGTRQPPTGDCLVTVEEADKEHSSILYHYFLALRLDLFNHSSTGFEWGYYGSGPAQLALAILADHLDNDALAVRLHQHFKQDVIAKLPRSHDDLDGMLGWTITGEQVQRWIANNES